MRFITPLDDSTEKYLFGLLKNGKTFRLRMRAHAILLSSKKYSIDAIADIYNVHRDTVSRWINNWEEKGVEGLEDAPKPGRPRVRPQSEKKSYVALSHLRKV
jgi:transposase